MADASWTKVHNDGDAVRRWTATINSTDTQTAILDGISIKAKEIKLTINIGTGESAIQIKGSISKKPASDDMQVLVGGDAISADFDDRITGGLTALQVTGATTANDTLITVVQVV